MITVKVSAEILQEKKFSKKNSLEIRKIRKRIVFDKNFEIWEKFISQLKSNFYEKVDKTLILLEGSEGLGKTTFIKTFKNLDCSSDSVNFFNLEENQDIRGCIKSINGEYKKLKFLNAERKYIENVAKRYLNLHEARLEPYTLKFFDNVKTLFKDESVATLLVERSPLSVKHYHEKWLQILNNQERRYAISETVAEHFLNSMNTDCYISNFNDMCKDWIAAQNRLVIITFEKE